MSAQKSKLHLQPALGILFLMLLLTTSSCGPVTPTSPALTPTPLRSSKPAETDLPAAPVIPEPSQTSSTIIAEAPCIPPATPVIDPAEEVSILPGKNMLIRATAEGADEIRWNLDIGEGNLSAETGSAIGYTAPAVGDTTEIVSAIAYNECGDSATVTLVINVENLAVALETIAIPAAWMTKPGVDPTTVIGYSQITEGCQNAPCDRFTYTSGSGWGGIMWWPLACGESGTEEAFRKAKQNECGIAVFPNSDIRPSKLTFYARGEKGGEVVEFKVGAGDIEPIVDRYTTGIKVLEQGWTKFEIDLEGIGGLQNAIALFTWVATDTANPNGVVFYLDEVKFEGME